MARACAAARGGATPAALLDLPPSLLDAICRHLSAAELRRTLPLVCKQLDRHQKSSQLLWTRVYLVFSVASTGAAALRAWVRQRRCVIEELVLLIRSASWLGLAMELLAALSSSSSPCRVRSLNVCIASEVWASGTDSSALAAAAVQITQQLRCLKLRLAHQLSSGTFVPPDLTALGATLEDFEWSSFTGLLPRGLDALTRLQRLLILPFPRGSPAADAVVTAATQLTALILEWSEVGIVPPVDLSLLVPLTRLECLSLGNTRHRALPPAVGALAGTLTFLSWSGAGLAPGDSLQRLTGLRRLALSRTRPLPPHHLDVLSHLVALTSLSIMCQGEGFGSLPASLAALSEMQDLCLLFNDSLLITPDDVRGTLAHLSALKELELDAAAVAGVRPADWVALGIALGAVRGPAPALTLRAYPPPEQMALMLP
eukprot:scaffold8.g1647.t1